MSLDDALDDAPGDALGDALAEALPGLVRFATSLTRDRATGEDLAMEAVTRAIERSDDAAAVSDLGAWLRRVVHNLAIDRSRRTREIVVDEIEERWMTDEYTVDPEAVVAAAETRAEIEDALVRLPAIYRHAVVLHDIEGLPVREIAELAAVDLPAAKQRLRRGRMIMVSALAEGHERRLALRGVPMRCWDARLRVSDYLDGDVDTDTARMLESHLATCPTCPPLVAALVGVRDRMGRLRDPDSAVDPDLAERLRRRR